MKVQHVSSDHFGVADARQLALPDTGLVLVTGPNGVGKSTCVEAVSAAVWGKSLRGADLWHDGTQGSVAVQLADGHTITRTRNRAGKQTVEVRGPDGPVGPFDTAAAATAWLQGRYGTHARWAATCVFRSGDVDRFSSATDAERKALLEELLGLGQFERAAKAAREEARQAAQQAASQQALLRAAQQARLTATAARNNARNVLTAGEDTTAPNDLLTPAQLDVLRTRATDLRDALAQLDADLSAMRAPIALAQAAVAEARAAARHAEQRLAALCDRAECPTCAQPIGASLVAALRAQAQAAVTAAKQAHEHAQVLAEAAAVEEAMVEDERSQARDAMNELRARVARHDGASKLAGQVASQRAAAQHALEQADAQLEQAAAQLAELEQQTATALYAARVAEAVEKVLGTRGVRAMLSSALLGAVEGAANWWLGALSGGEWQLQLGGVRELKSGGQSDTITLDVTGVAGGRGYKAMSSGQRRRVDLALLLGLAEVSSGPDGTAGTLWFDECMDALDTDGVAAVCAMLRTLASERCVVVISHSEELVAGLRGDAALRVELAP